MALALVGRCMVSSLFLISGVVRGSSGMHVQASTCTVALCVRFAPCGMVCACACTCSTSLQQEALAVLSTVPSTHTG